MRHPEATSTLPAPTTPESASSELRLSRLPSGLGRILQASPRTVGLLIVAAVLLIGVADWWIGLNLSLGAVYVIPILLAAAYFSRSVIVGLAVLCSFLRLEFGPASSSVENALNFVLVMSAYVGCGFFIREVVESRRKLLAFAQELQQQQSLRRKAEDQLHVLAESSPAAIMTLDESGGILAANQAAIDLFGAQSLEQLATTKIGKLLPVLNDALRMADSGETFRTAVQCQGRRMDGSPFHAHMWFSTYSTEEGRRLAAIAVDSSDEIREREENNLRQLLTTNRVLTAAVFHEIRNLCASISTAYANLTSATGHPESKESETLGVMITALGRLASSNLHGASRETLVPVRLPNLLDQFRIVAQPAWTEIEGNLEIRCDPTLPEVVGDPQGLMQVMLNLMSNSLRAVETTDVRAMSIEVEDRAGKVVLSVLDSGRGISDPQRLFVPFQSGADRVGLGLYLSRALMRSFGGDLRHVPTQRGCRFELDLVAVSSQRGAHVWVA
jgi:PAS domain S-box-containing protein